MLEIIELVEKALKDENTSKDTIVFLTRRLTSEYKRSIKKNIELEKDLINQREYIVHLQQEFLCK